MNVSELVALHARAWIETRGQGKRAHELATSPSTRGRGLKLHNELKKELDANVALHARAWIETLPTSNIVSFLSGRPPREGVD